MVTCSRLRHRIARLLAVAYATPSRHASSEKHIVQEVIIIPKSNDALPVTLARSAFIQRIAASAAGAAISFPATPRFTGTSSIVAVGRRYVALHPREADAALLARLLAADQSLHPATRVRRDFTRGDVVVVDGWLVARSEARTCALASLVLRDAD